MLISIVIFTFYSCCNCFTTNYAMARLAGIFINKARIGNRVNTRSYFLKPSVCSFLKTQYPYANYYLTENKESKGCYLQNTYSVYTSDSHEQLLMIPPEDVSSNNTVKVYMLILMRRGDNSVEYVRNINKDVVEKVLSNKERFSLYMNIGCQR